MQLSAKDHEAADALCFLSTSPSTFAMKPSDQFLASVPLIDLEQMNHVALLSNLHFSERMEEKQPETEGKNAFRFLLTALRTELGESVPVDMKNGKQKTKKRRSTAFAVPTTNKRRSVSVHSDGAESAQSEPIMLNEYLSASINSPRQMKGRMIKPMRYIPGRKIGAYYPEERRMVVQRYLEKRKKRVWTKKIKYNVRKTFADSRLRVKGRFISKEDEAQLREMLLLCI